LSQIAAQVLRIASICNTAPIPSSVSVMAFSFILINGGMTIGRAVMIPLESDNRRMDPRSRQFRGHMEPAGCPAGWTYRTVDPVTHRAGSNSDGIGRTDAAD
jgi:hypothetical protein